ncbi:DNA/RNA helicase domain-containing protein [Actinomadura fibrosa]|uniref:DNA/RNA helicase domain-containing protein n=1 Tax=Actinomadura fibrosa TaxID=111802 RepID=A0ABW2XM57_9ACTN|nr:DNA/RNA helicase domain-containing protein [Actinomadura fibrosa]
MDSEHLARLLRARVRRIFKAAATKQELQSWRVSPKTVAKVLVDAGLGEVIVLLEMSTLASDARIDMLLVGSHPECGELSVVVVENKQWSRLHVIRGTRRVVHPGSRPEGSQHPVEQVWDYCRTLQHHLPMLHRRFHGLVNLHQAPSGEVAKLIPPACELRSEVDLARMRIFGEAPDARREMGEFLACILSGENAAHQHRLIDQAHVRPSEALMLAAQEAVRGRALFTLLDEQRAAVDRVFQTVEEGFTEDNKQVFIITGGPGTGKSVLALELLGMLSAVGSATVHASGSNAFARTLREHVKGRRGGVDSIFTYFHQHRRRTRNHLNVLICDEAHRLRKDSNLRYDAVEDRSDTPQIQELIDAARVPVFLLDPRQVVRRDEVGTPEEIRRVALEMGIAEGNIHSIELSLQFRQHLCPEYVSWLEDLLGYEEATPRPWEPSEGFHLLRADNPQQMEDYLRLQIALNRTARITAGYCWRWTKEAQPGGRLADDIRIDGWKHPWNADKPISKNNIPGKDMWATDPHGFEQVGCIYTAQSLDWDYTGVIMGPDYTWRGNHWLAAKNQDPAAGGPDRHQLVRNIYRVLATRGKYGAILYSTDPGTRALLAELGVPPVTQARAALQEQHQDLAEAVARTDDHSNPTQGELF